MNKLKNKLTMTTTLFCLLFGISGCGAPQFGNMQGGVPVEAISLKNQTVTQSSVYQAKLISRYSVSLQPQILGQVANIYVKSGDNVKAGALLMLIDKRKQQAALNSSQAEAKAYKSGIYEAKSTLKSYEAQLPALESALELNRQEFKRYSALYAKKSVSKQDLEKYTDSLNKAKADLQINIAQIQAQKAALSTARSNYEKAVSTIKEQAVQLQYYKITAPYSGIIGDIPVKIGNYVTVQSELLSITQNKQLEINIGLPVDKIFELHNGLPVEVLDNNGNTVGHSTISFISPKVDTETQTLLVKAILENKTGILKADQSVKVRVIFDKTKGILVPTAAISHFGGQDFAFVIVKKGKQNFVKQVPVKLGDLQDNNYPVLSGLKEGDKIVSQGIQKLMDGAPVTNLSEGK
ncbi:MAG: efflux RND transporter periplasmic adaptor subunit [bacterium]